MRPFTNSHLPDLHGLPEWLLSFIVTVPSLASVRPSRGISSPRVRWTRAAAPFAATAGVFCLPQFGPPRSERTVTVSGKRLRKRRTWERIQLSEAHTLATSSLPKTSSAAPRGFLPAPRLSSTVTSLSISRTPPPDPSRSEGTDDQPRSRTVCVFTACGQTRAPFAPGATAIEASVASSVTRADSHQRSRRFSINVATDSRKVATLSRQGSRPGAKRRDHDIIGRSPFGIPVSAIPPPKGWGQGGGAWCARDA